MINFVIAFDNHNSGLGKYFEDCKDDIISLLDEQCHLVKSSLQIASHQCSEAHINITLPQLNSNPFIFIAYTHGADNGLRCNGVSFVSVNNCRHFVNSLFYSTACHIGKKLAPELINNGCRSFIGFIEESEVAFENPDDRKVFIDSDNFGIKMFLTLNVTVGESFEAMKNFYTQKIDYYQETLKSPIIASYLVANREALICLGDRNMKKEDLFLSE
jgi:hypothetical protein